MEENSKVYQSIVNEYYRCLAKITKCLLVISRGNSDSNVKNHLKLSIEHSTKAYEKLKSFKGKFSLNIENLSNFSYDTFVIKDGILMGDIDNASVFSNNLIDTYHINPVESQESSNFYELAIYIKALIHYGDSVIHGDHTKQEKVNYDEDKYVMSHNDMFTINAKDNTNSFIQYLF